MTGRASAQRYFLKAARYHAAGAIIPKALRAQPSGFIARNAVLTAMSACKPAVRVLFKLQRTG